MSKMVGCDGDLGSLPHTANPSAPNMSSDHRGRIEEIPFRRRGLACPSERGEGPSWVHMAGREGGWKDSTGDVFCGVSTSGLGDQEKHAGVVFVNSDNI